MSVFNEYEKELRCFFPRFDLVYERRMYMLLIIFLHV